MNSNEYQASAQRTECASNRPTNKTANASPLSTRLLHATLGMVSETGELADAVKKWLYYDQSLDVTNLIEELGDCLWYIALACNALDVSFEEVMERNIAKLRERYPKKFDEAMAVEENRDRKAEREILEEVGIKTFQQPNQAEIDTVEIPGKCMYQGKPVLVSSGGENTKNYRSNYRELCSMCGTIRLYKKNKSGLCPDCAAEKRRLSS